MPEGSSAQQVSMVYPNNCQGSAGYNTLLFPEKKTPHTSIPDEQNNMDWNNTEPAWKMDCIWKRRKKKLEWRSQGSRQVFK